MNYSSLYFFEGTRTREITCCVDRTHILPRTTPDQEEVNHCLGILVINSYYRVLSLNNEDPRSE